MESDRLPCFSADGRVLFFVSKRHEQPMVSDRDEETIIATVDSDGIYAATLDPGDPSPLAPHPSSPPPSGFHPDPAGLMARAVALPITPSVIASLEMRGSRLFYETRPLQLIDGDLPGQEGQLHAVDLPAGNDRVVARSVDNHSLSARGDTVAVRHDGTWHLLRTGSQPDPEVALDVSSLRVTADPRLEWAEMVRNAWRLDRDVFFSRVTNGTDWSAVWTAYARLLPHLGSEDDVRFLLEQIQGELASSHTFLVPAHSADPRPPVRAGFLGVDYAFDPLSGRYRFKRILAGDNSRDAFRSPLTAPGLGLGEGDLLLAVNGRELRAPDNPDAALLGATGPVTLAVATSDHGVRRTVRVVPIADEEALRRFDRIVRSRALVDRLSNGRVGYVALSDFVGEGWGEFVRQFYPQANKQALIVDVRWNSGGFTSQAVLSVLRRTLAGGFVNRERAVSPLPVVVPPRDMVTLLNWGTGSDGDQFAYYFRTDGLGPLVGTRSWGGVQGINRPWSLMDGTGLLIPKDSLADASGHWIIENMGVAPDVEVDDRPDEAVTGQDVQLETAVKVALDRLEAHPPQMPIAPTALPAYPPAGIVPGASFAGSTR
jgi:tricorn protease